MVTIFLGFMNNHNAVVLHRGVDVLPMNAECEMPLVRMIRLEGLELASF